MRFLFTTIQFDESAFYGRVGRELAGHGHECTHLTISRLAARSLRKTQPTLQLGPLLGAAGTDVPVESEARRIEAQYGLSSLRDTWWTDPACQGRPESWCLERAVRTFRAVEEVFDRLEPDVLVPEVGRETMRTAAHLVALDRGVRVFFLFYTIFPNPLMLYVDRYDGPIVPASEVRPLAARERGDVEQWIAEFKQAAKPILSHRKARVTPTKLRDFARHLTVKTIFERENEYLTPYRYVSNTVAQRLRGLALGPLYDRADSCRPFVYFPLHVTDDFKIMKAIPHCADQAYLIEQIADALPQGYDLLIKEHPFSIGRNPLSLLRRVLRRPNVRLVEPYTNSHSLMADSSAVAVISSTVGLEALLYGKPVLTLGEPYYAGYGVTVDVHSFREIREAVPRVLHSHPDREAVLRLLGAAMRSTYAGAPQGVDSSPENAAALAASIARAADKHVIAVQRTVA